VKASSVADVCAPIRRPGALVLEEIDDRLVRAWRGIPGQHSRSSLRRSASGRIVASLTGRVTSEAKARQRRRDLLTEPRHALTVESLPVIDQAESARVPSSPISINEVSPAKHARVPARSLLVNALSITTGVWPSGSPLELPALPPPFSK